MSPVSNNDTHQGRAYHVAFLANSPGDMHPISRYLEKKGWIVKVFASFNELALYASENKLDHIFVSFSIDLPEIVKYPQLINGRFGVPVMPFGETTDKNTIRRLRAFGHDILLPPVSGPLIYSKLHHASEAIGSTFVAGTIMPEDRSEIRLKSSPANSLNLNRIYKDEEKEFFGELEKTLSSACEGQQESTVPVTRTKKLTVLPLADGMFTGLLVFVMGDEESVDPQLINNMRQKLGGLNAYLKFDGITTKSLAIEIDEVDFNLWTSHKARYVSKCQHRGKEVMMAFFDMEKKMVEIQPSFDPKMSQISIDNITPNVTIDFDAYLYLQSNERYLKYLHAGSRISDMQIKSLRKRNIDAFHIENDSRDKYQAYVAKNYLSATITSGHSYILSAQGKADSDGDGT